MLHFKALSKLQTIMIYEMQCHNYEVRTHPEKYFPVNHLTSK